MFLYEPLHEREARAVSTAILHVLWDLGFLVGHSLRTIADCRSMGRTDLTVRTSLMEARWLAGDQTRSEEHTSELQSRLHLVCRLLLEKKKKKKTPLHHTDYYNSPDYTADQA